MATTTDWLVRKPIAHRGLHSGDSECPENSLKAFERAMRKGLPFELDVHLLLDGHVCVFHDSNTKRMTGINRSIKELSYRDIKQMPLLESDQKIPLLEEVLSLIQGKVPILVEIKNRGEIGPLESACFKLLSKYRGNYAVVSFNPQTLHWFRKNFPEALRGQLAGEFKDKTVPMFRKMLLKNLLYNGISKPHFIGYDVKYLPNIKVALHRKRGIQIIGWTVRSFEELISVRSFCDNIVFEGLDPEVLY
ncbi:MAG: glycerophosphodiester phosphodiesterase [Spirochaetota bacterium]|nr:MAG: glycerophosphodiester phosphodiesterase [Spirochaetota bacterium]